MVAVIGDVHGCYYTLQTLVDKIRSKYPLITLYCVGDLVDRGNYSVEVIEYLKNENILFTKGNHDMMFLAYYRDPFSSMAKNWLQNGAANTIDSYELHQEKREKHLNIISAAPLFIDTSDCFISHAGISIHYKNSFKEDFLVDHNRLLDLLNSDIYENHSIIWCRKELLNIGKLQVVGHTHRKETFFDSISNTIYIDTTAFGLNKLSSAIIDQNNVIEIIDQVTSKNDSDSRWKYYL